MKHNSTRLVLSKISFLLLIAFLFNLNTAMAQKAKAPMGFEITLEDDEKITTEMKNNMRVNVATGLPVALYAVNFEVPAGSPESMAQYYLQRQSKALGIPFEKISNLRHHATRTTNAGSVVRYRQYTGDYPVNKGEVTISISPQNKVVYVMNTYNHNVEMNAIQPTVTEEVAYELAYNYLNVESEVSFRSNRLMVYHNSKMTRLAHEVIIKTNQPLGEWHVFVDARTQQIFKVVDLANYHNEKDKHDKNCSADCKHEDAKTKTTEVEYRRVDGTGLVFDPDPLSSAMVAYGGQYVDNGDATNASLDAERASVTLRDLTQVGSTFSLVGPRAEIVDHEAPFTGLWAQNSSDFSFNRSDQGFEPVNVYYHIDFLMGYINDDLGCNIMPTLYPGGVQCDPHGLGGADNSHYTGGDQRLAWGEGCVDDAEDSDVIHHELGHGLHDWVTAGGLSQNEGLSEGSGDYIAQSYNRGLGNWGPGDPAYHFVFNWDGHNECWGGRTTNNPASYPGGLVGQVHADGTIWATCLMTVWDIIGQQEMDKIFYEGLGMTNGGSNQDDTANAIYQAAINLAYTPTQLTQIYDALTACGYTLPIIAPPVAAFSADNTTICLDTNNTVTFSDDSSPAATSWSWTFEGGTPAMSTAQNPVVTYAAEGTYDVTLLATNNEGNDTLTETDYISVVTGAACPACSSTTNSTAIPISDGAAGQVYMSTITIAADQEVTDVNVTINISHTWAADLNITLTSPDATVVQLTQGLPVGVGDDDYIDTVFDQEAATSISDGSAPFTGTFRPLGDLSTINGEMSMGDWILTITDEAAQDGGQLNSWSLEVCLDPGLSVEENNFDVFSISPNPNNGEFTINLSSRSNKNISVDVYDIRGRSILNNSYDSTSDFNQNIKLNGVQSGMYLVKVTDGDRTAIKKIIVK